MNTYKQDQLQKYINDTKLIIINDYFRIRLSKELLVKYNNHLYDEGLNNFKRYVEVIKQLNINYPYNATPIFYMYIVPDENFKELLGFANDEKITSGGRPVNCYDLDGFPNAYGVSSNIVEGRSHPSIMQDANSIHEFAHLIHSIFFKDKNRFIAEGIADAITLYILDYESKMKDYQELIKSLKKEDILSAQELIKIENDFDIEPMIKNKSCSFEKTYISAYLFIRTCIETIEKIQY